MVGSFVICILLFCLLGMIGYKSMLIHYSEEECEMTWMFLTPSYQRIHVDSVVEAANPQYSLHYYNESFMFDDTTDSARTLVLTGLPALFIPGNAGSFRQCRSSASIAREMHPAEFSHLKHFDFFTVNLNEEMSGIFGGVLLRQTRFVSACIRHILSMYKDPSYQPKSVAIIGHSMGGLVAQALLTLPDFNASWVDTIIALASPLKRPVVAFDHLLQQFYDSIEQEWTKKAIEVTVVSIAGGHLDTMIPAHLTVLNYSLNIAAAAVPRNWAHTGHQVVVWCRRLQLAVTRALFLVQSPPFVGHTQQSALLRMKVFQDYLFHGREVVVNGTATFAAGKKGCEAIEEEVAMRTKRSGFICLTKAHSPWAKRHHTLLLATNSHTPLQVRACQALSGTSLASCRPLSPLATILPPKHAIVKFLQLEAAALPQNTSQVAVVLGNSQHDTDSFILIEECNRTTHDELFPSLWSTSHLLLSSGNHCTMTPINLPTLMEVWQTFQLSVTSCSAVKVSLVTPWYPQGPSYDSGPSSRLVLPISLLVPSPSGSTPVLMVWANRSCDVHVNLSPDPLALVHKVAVLYFPLLLPWLVAVSIAGPQTAYSASILTVGATILYSLTSTGTVLSWTDWYTLSQERLWCAWVPHLLLFVAIAMHHLTLGAVHLACSFVQWVVPLRWQLVCVCSLVLLSFIALATTTSAVSALMMVAACMLKAKTPSHRWLVSVVMWLLPLLVPSLISWTRGLGVTLWQVDPHLPLITALNAVLAAWLLVRHSAQRGDSDSRRWLVMDAVLCRVCLPAGAVLVCSLHAYRLPYFVLAYALSQMTKELIV